MERLTELLLAHKIQVTLIQHEPEWTPIREAWRGSDHTLGNRVQERATYVQAQAFSGHSNTADVLRALQDEGFNVLSIIETAQATVDPALTVDDLDCTRAGFAGLQFGIIDVAVQLELVAFRPAPQLAGAATPT